MRIDICTSGCRVGPFQQPCIPPKKVSQQRKYNARSQPACGKAIGDRGDALSAYCCNIILMERGGGRQQCGHMLYVKCAGCRWELRKSGDGCTILGVSAREKKSINNDAPETICMPTPGPQAARVCTDFVHFMEGWAASWFQDGVCGRQQSRMVMNAGV